MIRLTYRRERGDDTGGMTTSRVATFHPAWGAVAMTASGVALVSLLDPWAGSGVDDVVGAVTLVLALVIAVATSVVYIARMTAHREAVVDDLANPVMGAMTAAWPASLLIAALAVLQAGALGIISISRLSSVSEAWPDATSAAFLVAAMLWGFGLWWAVFAGIVIFRQRRELRFQLPVWGFGFPTAAWIALTVEIARHWDLGWLAVSGAVLWAALIVAFAVATVATLVRMRSGAVFGR